MKPLRRFIIILTLFTACKTHKNTLVDHTSTTQNFANQGEQEDYWAKQLFEKAYQKQTIKRYSGDLKIIDENTILYGNTRIKLSCLPQYKSIFASGLIYPEILNVVYIKMPGIDSTGNFTVSDIEEKAFLSPSVKIKRFELLVWAPGMANPFVYFIELTDRKANTKTSLADFIKNAELTFVKKAWVDI